jgi:hypothetical protein
MTARFALSAVLAVFSNGAGAQPAAAPDRAADLIQLQINSRAETPPQGSMDGPRATSIYKRFSDPAARGGQVPGAAAPAAGPGQQ